MGRFYGEKIIKNDMILDEVPKLWRKMTEEWLEEERKNESKNN